MILENIDATCCLREMAWVMGEYWKPFQYTKDFNEDHMNMGNFKPAATKIYLAKKYS